MARTLLLLFLSLGLSKAAKLSVSGDSLMYDGQEIYLNGVNAAWNNYGKDFGNDNYDGTLEGWMADVSQAGGNAFRMFVHADSYSTPAFDINGYVTGCDYTGDFINDMVTFLDAAEASNILTILSVWNVPSIQNPPFVEMINDDSKLQSYFENCLTPLARAVAGHPALGAWEAMNEPEGMMGVETNSNPCYDTNFMDWLNPGWAGGVVPTETVLSFVGKVNTVIRENDPTGMITIGAWTSFSTTNAFNDTANLWSDECLNAAANSTTAGLDFVCMHCYSDGDHFLPHAPFLQNASDYQLDKPVVIGEFSSSCGNGYSEQQLHEYSYDHEFSGTLTWHWIATGPCSDTREYQRDALAQLADKTENGLVDITVG